MNKLLYLELNNAPCGSHPHIHDCWEIVYYIDGSGIINVDGKETEFKKGDILCLPPWSAQSETTTEGFRSYPLCIDDIEDFDKEVMVFHDNIHNDFLNIFERLYRTIHTRPKNWQMLSATLVQTLCEYMKSWKDETKNNYYVDVCIQKIIKNISNCDFQIDEIFEGIPFSKEYFKKLFKKETAYSLHEYLNARRIGQAKKLLEQTNLKIKNIAHKCGYKDEFHFSKIFKKKTGFSPSDWSKNNPR